MLALFLKGIIIGFSIAAPVGPIGLLCIQRTLLQGRGTGFISGLGAATADAFYGGVAAFGVGTITHFLTAERHWIHLIGGVALLLLGIRTFHHAKGDPHTQASPTRSWQWVYGSTLMLTMANPSTIVSFMAVFAALGMGNSAHLTVSATWTVAGVFLGSAAWWFILSTGAGLLRGRLTPAILSWTGRGSALILASFGLWGILSAGLLRNL